MNKKIKLAIAGVISIGTLSSFLPGEFSLFTEKAYAEASTYSLADEGELKSLEIKSSADIPIELCDDYDGYKRDLTDNKTYYITLDAKSNGLKVFAQVEGEGDIAKVFETNINTATPHDIGEEIPISEGLSTIYIRTYANQEALDRAVKNKDVTHCTKEYKININKLKNDGSNNIYLDDLSIELGKIPISFNKDVISYDVSVNPNLTEAAIRAVPENEKYTVKIDKFKVSAEENYLKIIPLNKGKNEIKVNITDNDVKVRTYTLNITRGEASSTSSANTGTAQTIKANQWVQVNGKWQYNDAAGNPVKNTWLGNYYLQTDGNMATGWLSYNNKWYYLGNDGAYKTGWIYDGSKYYYLYSDGSMASNTMIDGYNLDSSGAWSN